MNKYDEYMNRFRIKGNGTLLDIFKQKTKKMDGSETDTDKKRKIRLQLLERYYGEMREQPEFDEEEYQAMVDELTEFVKKADAKK